MRQDCKLRDSCPSTVVTLCQKFLNRPKKCLQKINLSNGGNPSHTAALIWKDTCSCWWVHTKLSKRGLQCVILQSFLGCYLWTEVLSCHGQTDTPCWVKRLCSQMFHDLRVLSSHTVCSLMSKSVGELALHPLLVFEVRREKPKIFLHKNVFQNFHVTNHHMVCFQRGDDLFASSMCTIIILIRHI